MREKALSIFLAGLESVKPDNLIKRFVSIDNNFLHIDTVSLDLSILKNIYVVGTGKASASMAKPIEEILGSRITAGHIITKYGHSTPLDFITITEASHPLPDENGIKGTNQVLSIVNAAGKDDLVICLISGGGSVLLVDVPDGCSLADLKQLNNLLLESGADISEMNCIRKHLSKVKGGHLAKAASPARVVSLILSDVIGDPLDVIASGPTAPDPSTFEDALRIINKYKIGSKIPVKIMETLRHGFENKSEETLKITDEALLNTSNFIIGTNLLSLKTAKEKAGSLGYDCQIITNKLAGDVIDVASFIVDKIKLVKKEKPLSKNCLLFAGEPTVKVTGKGSGGRNQHLALIITGLIRHIPGVTFLSAGTDGNDGPTDAAGAVVDTKTSNRASDMHLNIEEYIKNNDSYNFFKEEGGLIITGPTQTNVMDLMVALID